MAKDRKKYLEGVTPTGFRYHIDRNVVDDMELVEAMAALEDGDISAMPHFLNKLFGKKQKEELYAHCREKGSGRVPMSAVMAEVKAIMTNPNLKKS